MGFHVLVDPQGLGASSVPHAPGVVVRTDSSFGPSRGLQGGGGAGNAGEVEAA